jgi:signal transduction histidine kinase/ActR/RegA family two-component response regulator
LGGWVVVLVAALTVAVAWRAVPRAVAMGPSAVAKLGVTLDGTMLPDSDGTARAVFADGGPLILILLITCPFLLVVAWRLRVRGNYGQSPIGPPYRFVPVFGCLVLGLSLSAMAFYVVDDREQQELRDAWGRRATSVASLISGAIEARIDSVSFLRDFLASSDHVTPAEFRHFVTETLRRHPEIHSYSWAPPARLGAVTGDNDRLTPRFADAYPIVMAQPAAREGALVGLDLASCSPLLAVLEESRDNGKITVAPDCLGASEDRDHVDVMIVAPVYRPVAPRDTVASRRADLAGFVIAQLAVSKVCEGVLAGVDGVAFDVEMYDTTSPAHERILHGEANRVAGEAAWAASGAGGERIFVLEAAKAKWLLTLRPGDERDFALAHWLPVAVFATGIFLTLVLAGYLATVLRRTSDLRESNAAMHEALERERASMTALEATMQHLEVAMQEAQAATKAKSEFLANMSHEIRTPMTAIVGFTEILASTCAATCGGGGSHACNEHVATVRRNADYLLAIINDILDISKIEADKLDIEHASCSLVALTAEIQSLMKVKADAKGLTFDTAFDGAIPETIRTDPNRLKQILINLVGNALKFTERGAVQLRVRYVAPRKGAYSCDRSPFLQFEVIDTGIGMTPEQIGKLFQPFTQADTTTTRRFGGTGLGLTISKRLAQYLGGDISLESNLGRGSTFRVWITTGPLEGVKWIDSFLPAAPVTRPDTTKSADEIRLDGCRILLAEDGPDNQRLVKFVLEKVGASVVIAENGKIAVLLVAETQIKGDAAAGEAGFDAILMDMQMPVMDGYQATKQLRRQGYVGPIVALTAHAMATDRPQCIEVGCDDYESKPVDRKRLVATLARHIAQSRQAIARTAHP